jgi:hypothetical protein
MLKPASDEAFYSVSINFNVSALLRYREAMESFIESDRHRGPSLIDPGSPSGQAIFFHNSIVRGIPPVALRSSFLVAAWALYKSAVLELAAFLSKKLKLPKLSIDPEVGFRDATAEYFRSTLGFERDANPALGEELRVLYKLRNAIAHGGTAAALSHERTGDNYPISRTSGRTL